MRIPTVTITDPETGRQKIVNADDPRAKGAGHAEGLQEEGPEALTRTDLARMPKADVAELLTMHGIDPDPKAKVQDLRAMASRVIFADL